MERILACREAPHGPEFRVKYEGECGAWRAQGECQDAGFGGAGGRPATSTAPGAAAHAALVRAHACAQTATPSLTPPPPCLGCRPRLPPPRASAGKSYRHTRWLPRDVLAGAPAPCNAGGCRRAFVPACVARSCVCPFARPPALPPCLLTLLHHYPPPPTHTHTHPVDRAQLLRNFEKRAADGGLDAFGDEPEGVHPSWLQARAAQSVVLVCVGGGGWVWVLFERGGVGNHPPSPPAWVAGGPRDRRARDPRRRRALPCQVEGAGLLRMHMGGGGRHGRRPGAYVQRGRRRLPSPFLPPFAPLPLARPHTLPPTHACATLACVQEHLERFRRFNEPPAEGEERPEKLTASLG